MKTLFLSTFFLTNAALAASSISLYVTPPENPLDWESPGGLFTSVLKNKMFSSDDPLGQTITQLDCPDHKEILSVVTSDLNLIGSILFEGRGLGLLYHTFPGKVAEAEDELKKNILNAKTRFVRVEINAGQCARVKDFLTDFREKKIGERFGFPHRPLMAEGSNGTSLAVTLLEVAGVLDQGQREAWETGLFLPHKISGMPLKDQFIGILSLMGSSWGKGPDKSSIFKFWNPEKISSWVDDKIKSRPDLKMTSEKAVGVMMDMSHLPAPQGSYWQQANDPEYSKKKY